MYPAGQTQGRYDAAKDAYLQPPSGNGANTQTASTVHDRLNEVESLTSKAHDVVTVLEQRLDTVLRASPPRETSGTGMPVPTPNVANRLTMQGISLHALVGHLMSILDRLEVVAVIGLLFVFASTVSAQVKQNPNNALFTPSADHAAVARYESGLFVLGAATPSVVTSLGKPTPNAQNEIPFTFSIVPLALGNYEIKVRAIDAAGVASTWAGGGVNGDQSVPFARALLPPTGVRLP